MRNNLISLWCHIVQLIRPPLVIIISTCTYRLFGIEVQILERGGYGSEITRQTFLYFTVFTLLTWLLWSHRHPGEYNVHVVRYSSPDFFYIYLYSYSRLTGKFTTVLYIMNLHNKYYLSLFHSLFHDIIPDGFRTRTMGAYVFLCPAL